MTVLTVGLTALGDEESKVSELLQNVNTKVDG
jgi:hypothetical protein